MRPTLALASIDAAAQPHEHGHTCGALGWFNPSLGTRSPCPILGHLRVAREQVEKLHAQVHKAAHNPELVRAVMKGMTGFTDDDLAQMPAEDAAGWDRTAAMAIEELAHQLDRDPVLEARAQRAKQALEAAGIDPEPPTPDPQWDEMGKQHQSREP